MTQFVKMNFMSEIRYMKDLWWCDSCQTSIDNIRVAQKTTRSLMFLVSQLSWLLFVS